MATEYQSVLLTFRPSPQLHLDVHPGADAAPLHHQAARVRRHHGAPPRRTHQVPQGDLNLNL